jgi:hypothetical protein
VTANPSIERTATGLAREAPQLLFRFAGQSAGRLSCQTLGITNYHASMIDVKQQTEHAKWLLERTLNWIAAADVKVGVAMALDTAMFGGLAAAYGVSDASTRTTWAYVATFATCICLVAAAFSAAMAAIPRMLGPVASNIFFARIAEKSVDEYIDGFTRLDDAAFLRDLTTQIHRNSEIATAKHAWVRKSLIWSFLSAAPWASAIALLVKT